MQKGSAQFFVLLAILLLIGSGIYLFKINDKKEIPQLPQNNKEGLEDKSLDNYSNQGLGFTMKYSTGLTIKEDSEEEFNKRGNGEFRKNFNGYVGYEPGKFLGAVVVLEKEENYDANPFSLWVFDNPDNLDIDKWHHDFWYYPFVWGDFTSAGKYDLAPDQEATISGQAGKSKVIDYREGKPKFIYLSKDKKMYLFRIIGDKGDKILKGFKFLK